MAERLDEINVCCHWSAEDGNHVIERRPRSEVQVSLAAPQDLRISEKMALLAHIIAKVPRQASRIDNGKINRASEWCIFPAFADVEFSWSLTPFATNRKKSKGRD
jgi:hypothetical protein